jgi:hypothetical protein
MKAIQKDILSVKLPFFFLLIIYTLYPKISYAVATATYESYLNVLVTIPIGYPGFVGQGIAGGEDGGSFGNAIYDYNAAASTISIGGDVGGISTHLVDGIAQAFGPGYSFAWSDAEAHGALLIDTTGKGAALYTIAIYWRYYITADTTNIGDIAYASVYYNVYLDNILLKGGGANVLSVNGMHPISAGDDGINSYDALLSPGVHTIYVDHHCGTGPEFESTANYAAVTVPEPNTVFLLGTGLALLAGARRKMLA